MGTMLTYGSYLGKKENLVSSAAWVAAWIRRWPSWPVSSFSRPCFRRTWRPDQGPGLVFNILPVIFAHMPGGMWFGALFFVLLAVAP